MERRHLDLALDHALRVEADQPGRGVVQEAAERGAVDHREVFKDVRLLGQHHAPLVARRPGEIDGDDPVVGGVEIGAHPQPVLDEAGIEAGVDALDHRERRGVASPQIEREDVGRRPAVLHREDQPAAVIRRHHRDEGGRPVAVAEEFDVGADVAAPDVAADARAGLPRAQAVVEAGAVGGLDDAAVEPGREGLGEVLPRGEVANSQRHFVLAAVADGVDQEAAVAVDQHQLDPGGGIGAERPRVDDQVVAPGGGDRRALARPGGRPPVDGGDLFARTPQREVLGVAAAPRRADVGAVHQRREAALERQTQLVARQHPLGIRRLGVEPAARFDGGLILEPAVRVENDSPWMAFHHRGHSGVRRRLERRPIGSARRQRGEGGDEPREQ